MHYNTYREGEMVWGRDEKEERRGAERRGKERRGHTLVFVLSPLVVSVGTYA